MFFHTTNTLYLIHENLDNVIDIFRSSGILSDKITITPSADQLYLPEIHYNPYPAPFIAHVWQPASRAHSTILIVNIESGWPFLETLFNTEHHLVYFEIRYSSPSEKEPIYEFKSFHKGSMRIIRSMKDGNRWDFYQDGNILPFEKSELYTKKRITDRFNFEIIVDYLRQADWILDENIIKTEKQWYKVSY